MVRLVSAVLGVALIGAACAWGLLVIVFSGESELARPNDDLDVIVGIPGTLVTLLTGVVALLYAMTADAQLPRVAGFLAVGALVLFGIQALLG